ncbi:MAG: hypothetical protein GEU78_12520 [Actinobacteria bacterium]|nr:hypothetical protein [Actinomycetota bacterium]
MDAPAPAGKIRCPNCGALNREGAEWCGQCLQRFRGPEPPPPPASASTPTQPPSGPRPEAAADAPAVEVDPAAVGTRRGAFEVTEAGIQWTCRVCTSQNPIEAQTCTACGAPFAETVRDKRSDAITGNPNNAAMYSLFLPGAGHAYLGLWGDAIARGVIGVFTLGVAIASFFGNAPLVAATFGLVAFALWLIAAHDAYREALHQPGRVMIRTRHYGFVMLGVLGLLFMMLMITYLGLRAQR